MKMQGLLLFGFLALLAAVGVYLGLKANSNNEPDSQAKDQGILPDRTSTPPATNKGSEPPPAKAAFCPVPKPERVPEGLTNTLAFGGNPSLTAQLDELKALAQKSPRQEAAEALRWLIHQADRAEVLRHEALIVLGAWGTKTLDAKRDGWSLEWLAGDLARMLKDPPQSAVWRAYCVQHLGKHYQVHRDEPSFQAMDSAASAGREGRERGARKGQYLSAVVNSGEKEARKGARKGQYLSAVVEARARKGEKGTVPFCSGEQRPGKFERRASHKWGSLGIGQLSWGRVG